MWDVYRDIDILQEELSNLVVKKEEGKIITDQDIKDAKNILSDLEDLIFNGDTAEMIDLGEMENMYDIIVGT